MEYFDDFEDLADYFGDLVGDIKKMIYAYYTTQYLINLTPTKKLFFAINEKNHQFELINKKLNVVFLMRTINKGFNLDFSEMKKKYANRIKSFKQSDGYDSSDFDKSGYYDMESHYNNNKYLNNKDHTNYPLDNDDIKNCIDNDKYIVVVDGISSSWNPYCSGDLPNDNVKNMKVFLKQYDIIKSLQTYVDDKGVTKSNFAIRNVDKIIMVNSVGPNTDVRGTTILDKVLHFNEKIICSNNLQDIIISYFKIKSHKSDDNYEMYVDSLPSFKNNTLTIKVDFDHGS